MDKRRWSSGEKIAGISIGAALVFIVTAAIAGIIGNSAGDPRQYWVVPGAQHAQPFAVDPQEYIQRVDAFF